MTSWHKKYPEQVHQVSRMVMRIVFLMLALFLNACGGLPAFFDTGGSSSNSHQVYADWPEGWRTFQPAITDREAAKEGLRSFATHDGFGLQIIRLSQRSITDAFKYTKKTLSPDMLPLQVARIIADDIRANPDVVDLIISEMSPATLAGSEAFRLNLNYRSKAGLRRQSIVYGCIDKGLLTLLSFDAPRRHYFSPDLPTFERMKDSVIWIS